MRASFHYFDIFRNASVMVLKEAWEFCKIIIFLKMVVDQQYSNTLDDAMSN